MITERHKTLAPLSGSPNRPRPYGRRLRPAGLFSCFLWVATACLRVAPAHAAPMSCTASTCHDKAAKQHEGSAHARIGMTCLDCHGGDPKLKDETAHVTTDFRSPSNKREIAEGCAHCHSDVRRMNPYGLPTDQLDRYKTSKHGEQLFQKGDKNVAVCTDCHGVHDILKVRAPQSHTHPANIPQTCGRCHSDAKLMNQYKLPADAVQKYKTSYHAHILFEKGDLSAPTCVTCHGNHGAVPPGAAQVGQVCGKCHVRQRELFEQSPHLEPAKQDVFKECVDCHGNHAIQKASLDLFAKVCVSCHADDPKHLAAGKHIEGILHKARTEYERAETRVQEATVRGLPTEDEQLALQEARTAVMQLEALQHTLSPKVLQPVAEQADRIVKQALSDVANLERTERWKRLALIPIWAFLAAMATLFWLKRQQIEKRNQP